MTDTKQNVPKENQIDPAPRGKVLQKKLFIIGAVVLAVLVLGITSYGMIVNPAKKNIAIAGLRPAGETEGLSTTSDVSLLVKQFQEKQAKDQLDFRTDIESKVTRAVEQAQLKTNEQQAANTQSLNALSGELQNLQKNMDEKRVAAVATHESSINSFEPFDKVKNFTATPDQISPSIPGEDGAKVAKSSEGKVVVPPNGHIKGRLLNGVVAVVGKRPTNALVRLEGVYQAPNGQIVNLDGCHAMIDAEPDLSSGRVDGSPKRLTCGFGNGETYTWDVAGWIVDRADGIRGMQGVIVDNFGGKVGTSLLGGAIEGAGKGISLGQTTQGIESGGATSAVTGNVSKYMGGAMLSNVGSTLNKQISDYYSQYSSSVQVGGGREVDVVFTSELRVPVGSRISKSIAAKLN